MAVIDGAQRDDGGLAETGDWKQHFPTYRFSDPSVVLEEYKAASRTLESAERIYMNAANVTVLVSAAFGSLTLGLLDRVVATVRQELPRVLDVQTLLVVLMVLVMTFAITTVRYFADRQKVMVFSSRKLVVLRRMLGLSYGSLQLVLPNWRTEGADQPFAMRMFPGWTTSVAYPFWVIAVFSAAILLLLVAALLQGLPGWRVPASQETVAVGSAVIWILVLAYMYRRALYDTHERGLLSVSKVIAKVLRLRLVPDFEYVIYRAKLATYETGRLKVDLGPTKEILLFIEDRDFYQHGGISAKALGRAFAGLVGLKPRSGGSTITQQLVRTLFIVDFHKLVRRKIVELLLALWFEQISTKGTILDLYLSSVRFDKGVLGITAATKHFLEHYPRTPTRAEAFFLIERVSNLRSLVWPGRVDQMLRQAVADGLFTPEDAAEAARIYDGMVRRQRLTASDPDRFARFLAKWQGELQPPEGERER